MDGIKTDSSPRRRLRDRLVEREGTANPRIKERYELQNLILLVDDDLRETALALSSVESFLGAACDLIEREELQANELARLAGDGEVLDRLDTLSETVTSLRRKLLAIASYMR
jgi:hypothetical protein